jgi:hypothetical protein
VKKEGEGGRGRESGTKKRREKKTDREEEGRGTGGQEQ